MRIIFSTIYDDCSLFSIMCREITIQGLAIQLYDGLLGVAIMIYQMNVVG